MANTLCTRVMQTHCFFSWFNTAHCASCPCVTVAHGLISSSFEGNDDTHKRPPTRYSIPFLPLSTLFPSTRYSLPGTPFSPYLLQPSNYFFKCLSVLSCTDHNIILFDLKSLLQPTFLLLIHEARTNHCLFIRFVFLCQQSYCLFMFCLSQAVSGIIIFVY